MDFFSRFPKVIVTSGGKPIVITDFLRRITMSESFTTNAVVMDNYLIRDGETPELVSNIFYGTPKYHWVILMVNNITNPREEWPIPDATITEVVYDKYDFLISVPESSEYHVDDVITSDNGGVFIVKKIIDNTIHMRSQVGKILLTTTNLLNNTTTEVEELAIVSVIDPEEATHHYYDTVLGYVVDEDYSVNTISVSNYVYEVEKNDEKRNIQLLNSQYIQQLETQFANLITNGN